MTVLFFVTPAWQRYELSAVCFEQRRRVIEALELEGIEAHCVVIADDENLDLARAAGFATVERHNNGLGRKFNDGMEYAGRNGADWIVPIGSDSWIDPRYFQALAAGHTRTSRLYAVVDGNRLAEVRVGTRSGAGPYVFHRDLLAPARFRPADDTLMRHVDSSTVAGIGRPIPWERREIHGLQYVGFRGTPHITSYARLWERWGVVERDDAWAALAQHYPADLVERARAVLAPAVAA